MTLDLKPIAKLPLGHFPTPLERLDRLSDFLGGPEIWIKRDDCTGLAFGGNKTRKLEYLLADAREKNADAIITFGALQSNHVRQTIAACAKADIECHAVLSDLVPFDDPVYRRSGNLLIDHMSKAHIHKLAADQDAKQKLKHLLSELQSQSKTVYVIPPGGSSPTGVLGYVSAALEIGQQCERQNIRFDAVVHASATGGTQIGLSIGCRFVSQETPILGVNVYSTDPAAFEERIANLTTEVMSELKMEQRPALQFVHGFVGDGYGMPTEAMKEAVLTTFQLEGILLDPVYTGKAMAGLFDLCRKKLYSKSDKILFVHTGGAPGLFAYESALMNHNINRD